MSIYRSGDYTAPTPNDLNRWIENYHLTIQEFSDILGVGRRLANRYLKPFNHKDHLTIPYACTRLFLIWAGLVAPEKRENDFFHVWVDMIEENKGSFEDFLEKSNLDPQQFFKIRKNDPEKMGSLFQKYMNLINPDFTDYPVYQNFC